VANTTAHHLIIQAVEDIDSVDSTERHVTAEEKKVTAGVINDLINAEKIPTQHGTNFDLTYRTANGDRLANALYSIFGSVGYIRWIYVHEIIRENGIGTALITDILSEMRSQGVEVVYAHFDMNESKRIGEQIGFTPDFDLNGRWYHITI